MPEQDTCRWKASGLSGRELAGLCLHSCLHVSACLCHGQWFFVMLDGGPSAPGAKGVDAKCREERLLCFLAWKRKHFYHPSLMSLRRQVIPSPCFGAWYSSLDWHTHTYQQNIHLNVQCISDSRLYKYALLTSLTHGNCSSVHDRTNNSLGYMLHIWQPFRWLCIHKNIKNAVFVNVFN